jgi:hypothetical protein
MLHLDGYVLARALTYAISTIDGLPAEKRTEAVEGDRNDIGSVHYRDSGIR